MLLDLDYHFLELKQRINKGAVVKSTDLSEAYNFEQWRLDNPNARVLFAIQPNSDISFDTLDKEIQVPVGSKLFSLSDSDKAEMAEKAEKAESAENTEKAESAEKAGKPEAAASE